MNINLFDKDAEISLINSNMSVQEDEIIKLTQKLN